MQRSDYISAAGGGTKEMFASCATRCLSNINTFRSPTTAAKNDLGLKFDPMTDVNELLWCLFADLFMLKVFEIEFYLKMLLGGPIICSAPTLASADQGDPGRGFRKPQST